MEKIPNVLYFTLDEANRLVPFLSEKMTELRRVKSALDELLEQCRHRGIDVEALMTTENPQEDLLQLRTEIQTMGDAVNDVLFEIQEQGPVVKDIETGLADFYCDLNGETVFLCWKLGETEIKFWHGINEGFAQRKNLMERRFLESVTKLH